MFCGEVRYHTRLRNEQQAPANTGVKHQVFCLQPHREQGEPQTTVGICTKKEQVLCRVAARQGDSHLCPRRGWDKVERCVLKGSDGKTETG